MLLVKQSALRPSLTAASGPGAARVDLRVAVLAVSVADQLIDIWSLWPIVASTSARYEFGSCVCLPDPLDRSDIHIHGMLRSGELPLPARNAEFATSVERFLGIEHIRSHCLAPPILSL
jgi:hypothetical protein